jgi:hypothetical protein
MVSVGVRIFLAEAIGGELWYGQNDKIEILVFADNKPGCAEMVIALAQEIAATLGGRFEREAEP